MYKVEDKEEKDFEKIKSERLSDGASLKRHELG